MNPHADEELYIFLNVLAEEEKERLRRRLAELEQEDEHLRYGGREDSQKTSSGKVKKKVSSGKISKGEKKC